jgi:dolichol-phosphate mannosyltransferase
MATRLARRPWPAVSNRWLATASLLVLLLGTGLGFMACGMPGVPKDHGMPYPIAWRAYGERIEDIETSIETDNHLEPIVIGLDQYWLASEASFYDPDEPGRLPQVAGESLFGGNSLMWDFWAPPEAAKGRIGIVVSAARATLNQSWVTRRFSRMDPVREEVLTSNHREVGRFFWRVGYDYLGN